MTTFQLNAFPPGHLIHDGFLPQHPASIGLSAPSGISVCLPTTTQYSHDAYHTSSSYNTPRSLAPYPDYIQTFATPDFNHGEVYAISSSSTSARGRSGSGASIASGGYSLGSPKTAPTSPHSLNGVDRHYYSMHTDSALVAERRASNFQNQPPSLKIKLEPDLTRPTHEGSFVDAKPIADNPMCCLHKDCLDEKGQPKKFFSRKADVTRHIKSRHEIKYINCPKAKCERKGKQGFTRNDHLTEHLRGYHLEEIPKRQILARGKARKIDTNVDGNNEVDGSSDDLTPTESAADIPTSFSRGSSSADQAEHSIGQEQNASSDEDADNTFPMDEDEDEDYQPTPSQRPKTARIGSSKTKIERPHPYRRTSSKPRSQEISPEFKRRKLSQVSSSPAYTTSPMEHHGPIYSAHPSMGEAYADGYMMSQPRVMNENINPYYGVSSMSEPYHGVYVPTTSGFAVGARHEAMNPFHYPAMEG